MAVTIEPTGKKIGATTMGSTAGGTLAGAATVVLVWLLGAAGVDVVCSTCDALAGEGAPLLPAGIVAQETISRMHATATARVDTTAVASGCGRSIFIAVDCGTRCLSVALTNDHRSE